MESLIKLPLRLGASNFSLLCALLVAYSTDISCCSVDREGTLSTLLEPHGLVYTCLYVAFVQDVQVLIMGLDKLSGLRFLTSFLGAFYTWLIDLGLPLYLICAVYKLAWKEVRTDYKCTTVCMPIFAGAGVGVSWLAAFAMSSAVAWSSMMAVGNAWKSNRLLSKLTA